VLRGSGGRRHPRHDRGLRVVVGVKQVPLAGEPPDDHLHVTPGAAGHLVADQLRLLREAGPADRAVKLA
jgi:hypothetical protein